MAESREEAAIAAYFNLIRSKGGDDLSISLRLPLLNQLKLLLAGKPCVGSEYRDRLEYLMEHQPAAHWPPYLVIAREFYPFWMGDFKAISLLSSEVGFDLHPVAWVPPAITLAALWQSIDQEKFTTAENWAIKSYITALKAEDASQDLMDVRLKLAKILVVRMREAPATQKNAYRIVVDATLPLFELKKTRQLFLVVVREFYHFWSGNPDAKDHVLKVTKVSIL